MIHYLINRILLIGKICIKNSKIIYILLFLNFFYLYGIIGGSNGLTLFITYFIQFNIFFIYWFDNEESTKRFYSIYNINILDQHISKICLICSMELLQQLVYIILSFFFQSNELSIINANLFIYKITACIIWSSFYDSNSLFLQFILSIFLHLIVFLIGYFLPMWLLCSFDIIITIFLIRYKFKPFYLNYT
jgi:hypothetical protein